MKTPRRVVVTLEFETQMKLSDLKEKNNWTLWDGNEPDQVQVNVIREKPAKKAATKPRSKKCK